VEVHAHRGTGGHRTPLAGSKLWRARCEEGTTPRALICHRDRKIGTASRCQCNLGPDWVPLASPLSDKVLVPCQSANGTEMIPAARAAIALNSDLNLLKVATKSTQAGSSRTKRSRRHDRDGHPSTVTVTAPGVLFAAAAGVLAASVLNI
jgi:hypothetical protein